MQIFYLTIFYQWFSLRHGYNYLIPNVLLCNETFRRIYMALAYFRVSMQFRNVCLVRIPQVSQTSVYTYPRYRQIQKSAVPTQNVPPIPYPTILKNTLKQKHWAVPSFLSPQGSSCTIAFDRDCFHLVLNHNYYFFNLLC